MLNLRDFLPMPPWEGPPVPPIAMYSRLIIDEVTCPLCSTKIVSYYNLPLEAAARRHYVIAHEGRLTPSESRVWQSFYSSL